MQGLLFAAIITLYLLLTRTYNGVGFSHNQICIFQQYTICELNPDFTKEQPGKK